MGNFEKLSVLVIVVIIVMILVVAIYTWTDNPDQSATTATGGGQNVAGPAGPNGSGLDRPVEPDPAPWVNLFPEPKEEPVLPPVPAPGPKVDPIRTPEPTPDPKPEPKPEPASGEPWMYTVKAGDTFSEVVMRELDSIRHQGAVQKLNPGLDINSLRIGQQIKMPPKGIVSNNPPKVGGETPAAGSSRPTPGQKYTTRRGDTLEKISKRAYGTFDYWGEIWASNLATLNAPEDIAPGMTLIIPPKPTFAGRPARSRNK